VIGADPPQLVVDRGDLAVEVVDHRNGADHVRAPGLGNGKTLKQLAATDAEEIGDRARRTPGHERRVNALL